MQYLLSFHCGFSPVASELPLAVAYSRLHQSCWHQWAALLMSRNRDGHQIAICYCSHPTVVAESQTLTGSTGPHIVLVAASAICNCILSPLSPGLWSGPELLVIHNFLVLLFLFSLFRVTPQQSSWDSSITSICFLQSSPPFSWLTFRDLCLLYSAHHDITASPNVLRNIYISVYFTIIFTSMDQTYISSRYHQSIILNCVGQNFILISLMCLIEKQLSGKARDTYVTEELLKSYFSFSLLIFICHKLILIDFGVSLIETNMYLIRCVWIG